MTRIRSILFNIYLPLWTFSLAVVASPFYLAPPKIAAKVGYVWSSGIILGLRYICGIRHEIRGKENLPPPPFVIASKHQSVWDTMIFLHEYNAPVYILKKELLSIPLFGRYLKAMDMIPIDRSAGTKALKQLMLDVKDRLSRNHVVVIFPEGTRTAPGQNVKYQPGIASIYKELPDNIPVVPVALTSGVHWGSKTSDRPAGTIYMEYLKPIPPGLDRKEFAPLLQEAIETRTAELLKQKDAA